jgi:hypothetical protein
MFIIFSNAVYKPYEYKDVKNRGSKRVYGFISQQIAEVIPEAVSVQIGKG